MPKRPKNGNSLERLKFARGKFILEYASTPNLRLKLSKSAYWKPIGNDCYETDDLRAARAFRDYGDRVVERIFERTFQTHYEPTILPSPLKALDPHQQEGLKWILTRKRSYLAHAPGAGKTAQAIFASILAKGPGQSLFIVPPSLTINWEREIRKFTEWLGIWPAIGIIPQTPYQWNAPWKADFLICPDSMLTRSWVQAQLTKIPFKFIAVDEASRFKDPYAERSLAFYGGRCKERSYPGIFRSARHVVFLDGSPMPNRPIELWAPAYALHPESIDGMNRDDFGYRYCGAKPNAYGQWEYLYSSNEDELREKLQRDFMHVVTEDKLAHPERRRSMLFIDNDVRSLEQKTWERRHLESLTKNGVSEELSRGEVARFRRELGLRKAPWVACYVKERLEEKNESILLFAWHRDVAEDLARRLSKFKPQVVIGGVSVDARQGYFDLFQRGVTKLLILNIAAGGRGNNLQRADRVIFAEWSWTDELNKQCEKRASRRGNESEFVRCEYIVAPGSMDEPVLSSVFTKQRRVKKIIG